MWPYPKGNFISNFNSMCRFYSKQESLELLYGQHYNTQRLLLEHSCNQLELLLQFHVQRMNPPIYFE